MFFFVGTGCSFRVWDIGVRVELKAPHRTWGVVALRALHRFGL